MICKRHYRIVRPTDEWAELTAAPDEIIPLLAWSKHAATLPKRQPAQPLLDSAQIPLATEQELSDFLKSVERRAFKRTLYHVRNDESALDVVQNSMMKLAEHYGHKPASELPMLFQRILSNCTLDWFRRQKVRNALFSNLSEFGAENQEADFDLLETLQDVDDARRTESAEQVTERAQTLRAIESEILELPGRQREAFLMRYWEELDLAETAAVMGCSQGSVKTHCFRAIQTLAGALRAKGIKL